MIFIGKYLKRRKMRDAAEHRITEADKLFSRELADPGAFEKGELEPYFQSIVGPQSILNWLDTVPLTRKAEKRGIVIPPEWWVTKRDVPWIEKDHLNSEHRAKLKRLIREERFNQADNWVGLLVPILALLVALAALLKDLLIELLRNNSN